MSIKRCPMEPGKSNCGVGSIDMNVTISNDEDELINVAVLYELKNNPQGYKQIILNKDKNIGYLKVRARPAGTAITIHWDTRGDIPPNYNGDVFVRMISECGSIREDSIVSVSGVDNEW